MFNDYNQFAENSEKEYTMSDSGLSEENVVKHAPLEPVFSLPSESDVSQSTSANQSSQFQEETSTTANSENSMSEVFEEVIVPEKKKTLVESAPPVARSSPQLPSSPEPTSHCNHEQENAIEEMMVVPASPAEVLQRQPPVDSITESMRSPTLSRHSNVEKTNVDKSLVEQPKVETANTENSVSVQVPKVEVKKEKEVFILTRDDVRKARDSESEYKRSTIKIATPKHPLDRKTSQLNSEDSPLERSNSSNTTSFSSIKSKSPSVAFVPTINNNNNNKNSAPLSKMNIVKEEVKTSDVSKTDDATLFTVPNVPRHQTSTPVKPISTSLRLDYRSSSPIQRSTDDIGPLSPPSLAGVTSQARGVRRVQSQMVSSTSRFNGPKGWGVSRTTEPAVKDFRGSLYTRRDPSNTTASIAPIDTSTAPSAPSPDVRKVERSDSLKGASRRTCSAKNQQRAEWSKNARRYTSLVSLNESAIHTARQLADSDDSTTTALKTGSTDQLAQRSPLSPTVHPTSPTKESAAKSLQLQYTDLQEQFGKWQTQLADNQRVVAEQMTTKDVTPASVVPEQHQNGGSPLSPLAGESDGYRPISSQKTSRQRGDLCKLDMPSNATSAPTTSAALAGKFSPDELCAKKQILRPNARPANTVRFQARTRAGSPPHDILLIRSMEMSSKSSTSSTSSSPLPPAQEKTTSPLPPSPPSIPEPNSLRSVSQRKYKQLDPPKLDPREELMLAIRNSSTKKLTKVIKIN